MKDFFKELEQDSYIDQGSKLKDYLLTNKVEANKVITNKVEQLVSDPTNNTINSIYNFLNVFSQRNDFSNYLLERLLEVYLKNLDTFIANEKWHLLEIVMDIINKEDIFKGDKSKFEIFVSRSIQLLKQDRRESTSEKEIATDLFLELVLNSNKFESSKNIITDFLKNDINNPYRDYLE